METIYIDRVRIDGIARIRLEFRYCQELKNDVKNLPGLKLDTISRYYHIPYQEHPITYLRKFYSNKYRVRYGANTYEQIIFRKNSRPEPLRKSIHNTDQSTSIPVGKTLNKQNRDLPSRLMDYMTLKNYSIRTIRIYGDHINNFINHFNNTNLMDLTSTQVNQYIRATITNNNYSRSYQNQMINALKLYLRIMQNHRLDVSEIPRPKKEQKLPVILTRDEIQRIISNTYNPKHRTILILIYGTGIRLGETTNIKLTDIDYQRKLIHIRAGKGRKDRIVPLPELLIQKLQPYLDQYKPIDYLFEGFGNRQYSPRSIQSLFKKALLHANITKNASVHSLRHAFATHSLEDGIDIRIIQELLGHRSIKTTQIYTHISNANILKIKSPLDKLNL